MDLVGNNQQELFKTFNKLFDENKRNLNLPNYNDPVTLANDFNQFFIKKVSDIRENLPCAPESVSFLSDQHEVDENSSCGLTYFAPTTVDELRSIIKEHGIKTSSNDPAPSFLIKENIELLLPHLCNLVNLSLSSSSFDGLKKLYLF